MLVKWVRKVGCGKEEQRMRFSLQFRSYVFAVLCVFTGQPCYALGEDLAADPAPESTVSATSAATDDVGISGRCHDGHGTPLANVCVSLYEVVFDKSLQRKMAEARSADNGTFRFDELFESGKFETTSLHWIIAQADGRASALTIYDPCSARNLRLEFSLPQAKKVGGLVSDHRGRAVAGAVVQFPFGFVEPIVGVQTARTDAKGHFTINDLAPFGEQFTARINGVPLSVARTFRVDHPDYAPLRVAFERLPANFDVVLKPAAKIAGRVVYGDSGEPAAGITVYAQAISDPEADAEDGRAITDSLGRYVLNLNEAKYNIFPAAESLTAVAVASIGATTGQTRRARDLVLIPGAVITGHLIDARTDKTVNLAKDEFVSIGVYGPAKPRSGGAIDGARVQADGSYRVRVAPGANYVYVSGVGPFRVVGVGDRENVDSTDVEVANEGTVEVNFRVERPAVAK